MRQGRGRFPTDVVDFGGGGGACGSGGGAWSRAWSPRRRFVGHLASDGVAGVGCVFGLVMGQIGERALNEV